MRRHGLAPSNDERWERLAQECIGKAEREKVDLREFYQGLVAIMDSLDERLSVAGNELDTDGD